MMNISMTSNKEVEKFEYQTAGHEGSMLKQGKDRLMKPVSQNEVNFYEGFYKQFPRLQQFCPQFYGTERREGKIYIVLEDLTSPFQKPCIMDIKMGTSSVGEDANPEKKASMKAKDEATTTSSLGIRLSGFRVYYPSTKEYIVKDKSWGKKVKDNTIKTSIASFFYNGQKMDKRIIRAFLVRLTQLHAWMSSQKELRFYSSSLLFLYEGDEANDTRDTPMIDLRMIDFAHVHMIRDGGFDEGYLFGLNNLIRIFTELSEEQYEGSHIE